MQEMFDKYPTLFKERADCLNHLFCCTGNGYYWEKGELILNGVQPANIDALTKRLVNGKAHQHNKLSLRAESEWYEQERIKDGFYENFSKETAEKLKLSRQKTIDKLPDDEYYKTPRRKRWCFYINIPGQERIDYKKNFAELWNYPEDIKPDWAAAIEECKSLLREDGFEV